MSTLNLRIRYDPISTIEIEMDSATTIKYAAKRVAERLHWDDELYWGLAMQNQKGLTRLDPDISLIEIDGIESNILILIQP